MSFFDDASLVMIPSGYKTSKVYSVKPTDGTGDLAFTRSNDTATRVASSGLIEKVRTNYVLQSQAFDNASWDKVLTTISANTTANPLDGAVNADTITLSAGTSQKFIAQVISINGNFTISVYLKAGTHQFAQILLGTDPTPFANFDLVNGTAAATGSTATIVSAGNGWYRCSMSFTSVLGNSVFILACDSLGTARFQPTSSTGTLIAFGYQLETGDIATPYIATTTAAVSVGPVANVPRLDYLNSTCPRLLLEPQRVNLVTFSEQFDNAAWVKNNATITANSVVSPDGYTNADTYTATGAGNYVNGNATSTGSNTITYSVFAKVGTQNVLRIREANYFGSATIFNISTGTVTSGTGTITSYGNGWYRCTHSQAYGVGQIIASAIFDTTAASGTFYLYGAQFEVGAYATSYIGPTLGAAVTRGADAASKTGISSLIGQTEGTIFFECSNKALLINARYFSVSDGTGSNRIDIYQSDATNLGIFVGAGGAAQVNVTNVALPASGAFKFALAYANNDYVWYVNGTQVATDTSASVPATSAALLGTSSDLTASGGNSPFSQALLFKTRLSNADLAALTA